MNLASWSRRNERTDGNGSISLSRDSWAPLNAGAEKPKVYASSALPTMITIQVIHVCFLDPSSGDSNQ